MSSDEFNLDAAKSARCGDSIDLRREITLFNRLVLDVEANVANVAKP